MFCRPIQTGNVNTLNFFFSHSVSLFRTNSSLFGIFGKKEIFFSVIFSFLILTQNRNFFSDYISYFVFGEEKSEGGGGEDVCCCCCCCRIFVLSSRVFILSSFFHLFFRKTSSWIVALLTNWKNSAKNRRSKIVTLEISTYCHQHQFETDNCYFGAGYGLKSSYYKPSLTLPN